MQLNQCLNVDCLQWMRSQIASDETPFADLIIADPPFNINFDYDVYDDNKKGTDFIKWCRDWLEAATNCLRATGNIIICMGDEYVTDIDVICRKDLKLLRRNWGIWHYSFGQSGTLEKKKKFTRSKTHILIYSKSKDSYFSALDVAVPSDRLKKYKDKRADPRGKCPNDVFLFPRVCGTHKSRVKSINTQMPVELVSLWIKSMSQPNQVVFDPFSGSGTSLIAAKSLNRQYIGCELSPTYAANITKRLI